MANKADSNTTTLNELFFPFFFPTIPPKFKEASLANFEGMANVKAKGLKSILAGRSLFLHGVAGSGKTHLAVALAKNLLLKKYREDSQAMKHKGVSALFKVSVEIFEDLKEIYNGTGSERRYIEKITSYPLFVLDDIGIKGETDWAMNRYYSIINRCYNNGNQVIVTSNKNIQEIADEMDNRIASRLTEVCSIIDTGNIDYRIKLNQQR